MSSSIQFKVTEEQATPVGEIVGCSTMCADYLSPHMGTQRNSITSIVGKFLSLVDKNAIRVQIVNYSFLLLILFSVDWNFT